ncbi:hypothetical protein GCM10027082_31010 [Comamonas humi]
MDINQKIAQRRAELQKAQATEEAKRKQQEAIEEAKKREQARQLEEEKKAIKKMAEKEAARRVQAINDRLGVPTAPTSKELVLTEKQVSEEAEKKVKEHIRELARRRMTTWQSFIFMVLLLVGISGFFVKWWLGLILCFLAMWYRDGAISRHEKKIKAELGEK